MRCTHRSFCLYISFSVFLFQVGLMFVMSSCAFVCCFACFRHEYFFQRHKHMQKLHAKSNGKLTCGHLSHNLNQSKITVYIFRHWKCTDSYTLCVMSTCTFFGVDQINREQKYSADINIKGKKIYSVFMSWLQEQRRLTMMMMTMRIDLMQSVNAHFILYSANKAVGIFINVHPHKCPYIHLAVSVLLINLPAKVITKKKCVFFYYYSEILRQWTTTNRILKKTKLYSKFNRNLLIHIDTLQAHSYKF